MLAVLLLATLAAAAPQGDSAAPAPPIRQRIADAHGLAKFGAIERLHFTFNVKLPDKEIHRSWVWEPRSGRITARTRDESGKESTVTYVRPADSKDLPEDARSVDPSFINDQFWLLFPFHLAWDATATVEDTGEGKLPIGEGAAPRVLVKYPGTGGGYTPGDHYEVFLAPDHTLKQWSYHKAGGAEGKPFTWDGYAHLGPLLLSLEHTGPNGFRLWFTDVSAELTDGTRVTPEKRN